MTQQHAPAPWSYESSGRPGGNGDLNIYIIDKDKRKIAAVWGKRGEKEATAAVLMVAPEILALLRSAVDDYEDLHGVVISSDHWVSKAYELFKIAELQT